MNKIVITLTLPDNLSKDKEQEDRIARTISRVIEDLRLVSLTVEVHKLSSSSFLSGSLPL